jgi:hypothetical protein
MCFIIKVNHCGLSVVLCGIWSKTFVAPSQFTLVLANSKTERFLIPALAMFRHDCPLAVKSASTPWRLLPKRTWESFSTYWHAPYCCVPILVVALPKTFLRDFRTRQRNNQDRHTAERSISIGRESLQVRLGNRHHGVLADFTARGQSWRNMARTREKKAFSVLEFAKTRVNCDGTP